MLVAGAGEGAFLVAEQDRLDQVLRDGAAIDGDERAAGALGRALDGARDQLLAGAALAFDQDRDVGLRGARAQPEDLAHLGRGGDEVFEGEAVLGLLLELLYFAGQRADLELVADRDRDALGRGGLDQEVVGAGAHGFHGGIDAALGGQHDDGKLGVRGTQLGEDVEAAHVGHDEIEQHEVDLLALRSADQVERGPAAGRGDDVHARARDRGFEKPALHGIVVDNKNGLRHRLCLETEQRPLCP